MKRKEKKYIPYRYKNQPQKFERVLVADEQKMGQVIQDAHL
jgi:hypothetical protein